MKKNIITIILGLVVLAILGLYLSYTNTPPIQPASDSSTMPTTDDGSTQGAGSLSFVPPDALTTKYITANAWPPNVTVTQDAYSCTPSATEMGTTLEKTINGETYCVTTSNDGAAGSTYKTYTYETMLGDNNVTTSFVLQYVECGNYDGAQAAACKQEQSSFNPDTIVDGIMQSAAPASE